MKKLLVFALIMILLVPSILSGCAQEGTEQVIELKMATSKSSTSWEGVIMQKFADEFEQRTDGKAHITIYWNETLGKMFDEWSMITGGVSDIGFISANMFGDEFPLHQAFGLPYMMNADKLVTSADCKELLDPIFWEYLAPEYEGVHVLYPVYQTVVGVGLFTVDKPITCIEDLEGLQISAPAKVAQDILQVVGATPVSVSPTEIYTALERGMVDGYLGSLAYSVATKRYEPTNYCTLIHEMMSTREPSTLVVNQDVWDSLPEDIQEVLEGLRYIADEYTDGFTEDDNTAIDFMKNNGVEFSELTSVEKERFAEITSGIVAEWVEEKNAMGLPASDLVNVIREVMDN